MITSGGLLRLIAEFPEFIFNIRSIHKSFRGCHFRNRAGGARDVLVRGPTGMAHELRAFQPRGPGLAVGVRKLTGHLKTIGRSFLGSQIDRPYGEATDGGIDTIRQICLTVIKSPGRARWGLLPSVGRFLM